LSLACLPDNVKTEDDRAITSGSRRDPGWHHTLNWMTEGTLAEASLSGGSARPVLEKVCDGDISHVGSQFVVVRCIGSEQTLEFPVGKVLYRTNGCISHVRLAPQGDVVAFCDHPVLGDDRGYVAIVDLKGKLTRITEQWSSLRGLAWPASGREIWLTASLKEDAQILLAVSRRRGLRVIQSSPSYMWLQDISADGKVLLGNSQEGGLVAIHRMGAASDQFVDLPSVSRFRSRFVRSIITAAGFETLRSSRFPEQSREDGRELT